MTSSHLWPAHVTVESTLALRRPLMDLTLRQQQRVMALVGHWLGLPRDALDSIWHSLCAKRLRLFARPVTDFTTWPLRDVCVNMVLVRVPCYRGRVRRPAARQYLRVDKLLPGRIVGTAVTVDVRVKESHSPRVQAVYTYTLKDTGTCGTITHRSASRWSLYKGWELESGGTAVQTLY
jgi:hypothetical protein